MTHSEQTAEIFAALSKAQGHFRKAAKDANNPHFKSKYADLASVWDAIREPMSANGLAVIQDIGKLDNGIGITTVITHCSGQWLQFGPLFIPLEKPTAHGAGSAITYGKRYGLCAAIGVVSGDDDDDGNGATNNSNQPVNKERHNTEPAKVEATIKDRATVSQELAKRISEANNQASIDNVLQSRPSGFFDTKDIHAGLVQETTHARRQFLWENEIDELCTKADVDSVRLGLMAQDAGIDLTKLTRDSAAKIIGLLKQEIADLETAQSV